MKSRIWKIVKIIFCLVIIGWLVIVLIDYFNTKNNKSAQFCISKEEKSYEDRNVTICHGLGYNIFRYDFEGGYIVDFGPFWKQEKTEFND